MNMTSSPSTRFGQWTHSDPCDVVAGVSCGQMPHYPTFLRPKVSALKLVCCALAVGLLLQTTCAQRSGIDLLRVLTQPLGHGATTPFGAHPNREWGGRLAICRITRLQRHTG